MNWDWLFTYLHPEVADHWDYAMVTLIVRFIGVFAVMFVMQIALQASARVVQRVEKGRPEPVTAAVATVPVVAVETAAKEEEGLDDSTVAAIGLALALESRPRAVMLQSGGPSSWAIAGRMRQLGRMPQR